MTRFLLLSNRLVSCLTLSVISFISLIIPSALLSRTALGVVLGRAEEARSRALVERERAVAPIVSGARKMGAGGGVVEGRAGVGRTREMEGGRGRAEDFREVEKGEAGLRGVVWGEGVVGGVVLGITEVREAERARGGWEDVPGGVRGRG